MARKPNEQKNDEVVQMEVDENVEEPGGIRIGDIYIPPPPPPACTFDSNGPRLIITHIENINFKSYAGKQVLGPFHKSFTSIVGPNGSGKSNVIDSMLFVFGYRAQKIRSKKISVLIHNSDNHANVESCSVSVHFQRIIDKPGDSFEVVPNSQFYIQRTAFKDNSSYYAINGKRTQFKEVARLLRSHGIDLDHNRFLILQGEVEQIAMMKPKGQNENDTGMLEFLEDIIGSSRFKEPIELLYRQVEELNEQRSEKLQRVKAVEKEKDDLEEIKNEAIEYLKLENDICVKKNRLYQKYRFEEERKAEEASKKRDKITNEMSEVLGNLENLNKEKKGKETEYKKISEKFEQFNKVSEEKKEQYSALERQDLQSRENLKHSKNKLNTLQKSKENEQKKLEDLKKQPDKLNKEISDMEAKKCKLEKEKKVREEELAKVMTCLKEETKGLQQKKENLEAKLMELQKNVNETKSKMEIARSELELYLSTEKRETAKYEEMVKNFEKNEILLKEKKSAINDIKKRIPDCEEKLEKYQIELSDILKQESFISSEVKVKRLRAEDARSAMNANRSRGKVLETLMRQKEQNNIPGILGRLGDLGAIDEKYDIAISTACGPLDNIVTDTMTSAQKCVDYLKRNNVGVATFIALDKMDRWIPYTKQRIQTPENVPRLFDLIRVRNEKVLPAFYFALRDTLVAKDLEQATRIGLQGRTRFRVVTLKGELIDLAGTMSGGGKASKGRMGKAIVSDINPEEIEVMSKHIDQLMDTLAKLKDKKDSTEEFIDQMKKEYNSLTHLSQKLSVEIQALSEQQSSLSQQLKEQKEKLLVVAPDKKKVKMMESTLAEAEKDYNKASSTSCGLEEEVQRLHSQIMEITEKIVGSVQQKLDSVNNQIDSAITSITRNGVAIKTTNRNIKKCEDKIKSLGKEITETEDFMIKIKNELKDLEIKAKETMEKLEISEKSKEECEEKMQIVMKEIKQLKEKENKLNSDHIEIKNELDRCKAKVQDSNSKIKHWTYQLDNLKLQEVDNEVPDKLPKLDSEELVNVDSESLKYELLIMEESLQKMTPNMAAIAEYKKKESIYVQRVSELDSITQQRDTQRGYHDDLRKQRLNEFMTGFSIITTKLKEMYQMVTLGGDAELELVDSLDPFSEGIVFSVRPPKKSWKNISNLSGGEKTLSSLALVFALHYYKPTPLYVMDEIDAALDFKNVSIVGNYIKERTKNAQFIIISLRNNMFELADRLVGIYKTYNCTKSVTINPDIIASSSLPKLTDDINSSNQTINHTQ
ncbi:structural maintenance of chromosomes protein 4 [Centruroides vittatus]|uniref:structural maintenance of chromosomes protein 4 n=1 Tax=Centruroides vittatus TaxID=120091 RepID=UPI003510AC6C